MILLVDANLEICKQDWKIGKSEGAISPIINTYLQVVADNMTIILLTTYISCYSGLRIGTPLQSQSRNISTHFSVRIKSLLKRSIADSKRRGAWFSLERHEKSLLSLASRLEVKFESLDLLRAIVSVMKKLESLGDTLYARIERGTRLAWTFSEFARKNGNVTAQGWRTDRAYIDYLGNDVSSPLGGSSTP